MAAGPLRRLDAHDRAARAAEDGVVVDPRDGDDRAGRKPRGRGERVAARARRERRLDGVDQLVFERLDVHLPVDAVLAVGRPDDALLVAVDHVDDAAHLAERAQRRGLARELVVLELRRAPATTNGASSSRRALVVLGELAPRPRGARARRGRRGRRPRGERGGARGRSRRGWTPSAKYGSCARSAVGPELGREVGAARRGDDALRVEAERGRERDAVAARRSGSPRRRGASRRRRRARRPCRRSRRRPSAGTSSRIASMTRRRKLRACPGQDDRGAGRDLELVHVRCPILHVCTALAGRPRARDAERDRAESSSSTGTR